MAHRRRRTISSVTDTPDDASTPGTAATRSMPDTQAAHPTGCGHPVLFVFGVLAIVFGIIMPRFVDYQDVLASLQGLTLQDFLIDAVFGLIAWVLTGAIFTALIPGLGLVRGIQSYLILTGIGASIPLGPWNMAVLWVVIRGWGRPIAETTGGILLYGIFDQLSRFGLMFISGLVLVAVEATKRPLNVEQGADRRLSSSSVACCSSALASGSSSSSARRRWRASSAGSSSGSPAPSCVGSGARRPTSKARSSGSGSRSATRSGTRAWSRSSSRWPRSSPGSS